jgi:hypothetical protein
MEAERAAFLCTNDCRGACAHFNETKTGDLEKKEES